VRLRKLLGIILSLGNRVESANEGRKDKVAAGLYLDSLAKLSQVKAFDKETSFLHYVVSIVERNNHANFLSFGDDLPNVLKANRISWNSHQELIRVTTDRVRKIRSLAIQQAKLSVRSNNTHLHNDEVLLLRGTRVGMFVVNASKTIAWHDVVDAANTLFLHSFVGFSAHIFLCLPVLSSVALQCNRIAQRSIERSIPSETQR